MASIVCTLSHGLGVFKVSSGLRVAGDQDLAEGRGDRKMPSATNAATDPACRRRAAAVAAAVGASRGRVGGAGAAVAAADGGVSALCVLRTTDDPSSRLQASATLVRMEPQPDFMYPHQTLC